MAAVMVPIEQALQNYCTNLPAFVPSEPGWAAVHRYWLTFYAGFSPAAEKRGIAPVDQSKALEAAQKTLWTFARAGQPAGDALELGPDVARQLKFPRAEAVFALMGDLGAQIAYGSNGGWQTTGRLNTSDGLRLAFPGEPSLTRAFAGLAADILAAGPKENAAFERFLRADPKAILAMEKPRLALPPDAPMILANMPPAAADAWKEMVAYLARYADYSPVVEFRAIHHGLWVANYIRRRGSGRDLCGLIVQNSAVQVRVILYGQAHFTVGAMLDALGEPVASAYHQARWYEEFQHQWLFIPLRHPAETDSIKRLLEVVWAGTLH